MSFIAISDNYSFAEEYLHFSYQYY